MVTKENVEIAATAIVNDRFMQKGCPPITNVLEMLPDNLREEVTREARAALEAVKESTNE